MNLIILFVILHQAYAIIYQLNETEYIRMPSVFHLDPYEPCVHQDGGKYCTIDIDLVADEENDLLNMMKEYSERTERHFNHTRLQYGLCISNVCKEYLNNTKELEVIIETCLNDSFTRNYKLKTKLNGDIICNKDDKSNLEPADVSVAVFCLILVILHFVGNFYDFYILKNDYTKGNRFLLCFSIKRNWNKLTRKRKDIEHRVNRLKGFNGLRVVTIVCVIVMHSLLPFVIACDNTMYFEKMYQNIINHGLFDGTLLVQTFFITSGCLLAYHMQIFAEKQKITWLMIPKAILMRWLRLTPSYAVILAVIMTWARFAGSGPLWEKIVYPEVYGCRAEGWRNLIYINNYIDNSQCMTQTWYIAADMQLFVLGISILVLAKSSRVKKVVISLLYVLSLFILPLHTYFQNLRAHLIITPEVGRQHFITDTTFNNAYKRGHTNVTNYIVGICLGLLIYELQKKQIDIEKYKKFRYLVWASVPMGFLLIFSCGLFYMDGISSPLIVRTIFSGLLRAGYGVIEIIFILGMVFKLENIYRPIVEWQGWEVPARVSYAAYLLHLILIQIVTGLRTTLIHISVPQIILVSFGSFFISFLVAYPFWLLVEAPIAQLIKLATTTDEKTDRKIDVVEKRNSLI